ncbi:MULTISPECIES: hypothetical protein [unclassified Sphingopyxis]|uniref:hypothetical protein n=1 Tax=unclassified Sphingopyxis TaxID=2614943 RepID=UPI0007362EA7|nr:MULTISPECIES: hypothetical protein [unclassified Sphingopyxis]KTE34045.1 hypothetical protein ATE62_16550 [Sphingopyxis sp. HIX]KTE74444.1 hypothetical protein ATE72_21590 [Sphingopyxis sp. HXXIV]
MKVHFIRSGERRYSMRIERAGLPVLAMDPAPGFDPDVPHDMVHFVVEAVLGLKGGVFGQIAAGGTAGSFHVEAAGGKVDAREQRRTVRKQVARGKKLIEAQGREGELSELAAFLFDIAWRSGHRPDSPEQRAALSEADRVRATLSPEERAAIDAARPAVFAAFDRLAADWRALGTGEALVLEWPTLRRLDQPIG